MPGAEALCRRAIEITKKSVGEDNDYQANSLMILGKVYGAMGDYFRAEPCLRRALEIRKQIMGENDHACSMGLIGLGEMYIRMGDSAGACVLLKQALDRQTAVLRTTASAVSERQFLAMLADLRHGLDAYVEHAGSG